MTPSFSPLSLAAVFTLSLFLSALNFFFWRFKSQDQAPLWLAAWLLAGAMFALCRLLQYASFNEQIYQVLPRLLLTSVYLRAWLGYELANRFVSYRPPRRERSLIILAVAALVLLLWASDLILTHQVVLRTIPYGGSFHGVTAGTRYLPANLLNLAIGSIPFIRLWRASKPNQLDNRLMAMGYGFAILFGLFDFLAILLNRNWIRLSDYSYLPLAIFFTYIQVQQLGKLYREMDTRVQEQTSELLRTNNTLRQREQQALLSQQRLLGLVDSAMDAVITINRERKLVLFNPAAERMFGYKAEEILGQPLDILLPERFRQRHIEQIKNFEETGIRTREMLGHSDITGLKKGGREFSIDASISQAKVSGETLFTAIVRDTSERKVAEQALQRQLMEMRVLNSVATAGSIATDLDELLLRVTEVVGTTLYPDNFGIILVNEKHQTWQAHASYQGTTAEILGKIYAYSEGIVGKSISAGRAIRSNDIHREPDYMEVTPGIQSEIAVPIFLNGNVFGVLNAESRKINAFSEHDERLMRTIADSMSTAVEKIQLLQTEQRRREEAEILYNTTHDLIIERDLSKLLQIIVERAVGMLGALSGGLYLCDPFKRQVRCVVSYKNARNYVGTILNYGEGAAGIVAETEQPLVIEDYRLWTGRANIYEAEQPFISVLSVPMLWQDQVIGVIHVQENTQPRLFTEEDLQIARHFANQAAIAVENARLFEREQQRRQEAEILRESILSLTYSMEPEKLFEIILDTLQKLIPYDSASIELTDGAYFVIVAGRSIPKSMIGTRYLASSEKWGDIKKARAPLILADVQSDERFVKFEATKYIRGWMGIPLFARDKLLGYINLDSRTVGFYSEAHMPIAQIFGSQAAIAIENMILFRETTQRAQEASAIAEIGRELSGTLQLDAVLEKICAYAKNLLQADISAVYLSRPAQECLQAVVVIGPEAEQIKQYLIPIGKGILGKIANQKAGEIVNDSAKDPRSIRIEGTVDIPFEHIMGVPVLSENRLIGLIVVWRVGEGKEFKSAELSFLSNLAQQVAVAIENARLFHTEQKQRQQADTLREAAQKITSTLDQEQAIQWILDQLAKVVGFQSASVQLLHDGYLEIVGGRGWVDTSNVLGVRFPIPGDNPNSIVLQERRAVILENAPNAYAIFNSAPHDYIKSWLGVPLIVRDQVIGMFAVDHDEPNFYTEEDARLVSAFANQAAIAIDNAQLFQTTRQRLMEIEAVHTVSSALRSAQTLEEALPIILDELMHLLNAGGAAFETIDTITGETIAELARGAWASVSGLRIPAGSGVSSHVISTGEPYVSADVISDRKVIQLDLFKDLNAVACIPVIAQNRPIGALWIGRLTPFHPEEVSLLAAIGEMVGNAIHRMRLNEQTIRRADEFEALFRTSQGLASQWELHSLLETVVSQAMGLLHASGGGIYLYDAKEDDLEVVVAKGPAMILGSRLQRGDGMAGRVLKTRKHLIVDDYTEWENHSQLYENIPVGAVIEVPIIFAGDLIGVLVAYETDNSTRKYTESEARLLSLFASQAAGAIRTARLLEELQTTNLQLERAYDTTLEGWARALELRDKETHGHSRRVTNLTLRLARRMDISNSKMIHIRRGVLLHDIGKMGIPDHMLKKTGALSADEWVEMKKHPQYAYDLLSPIAYLRLALEIPYCHHEKWDGTGYPRGLKGKQIPLAARIFAIVDVYDALSFDRPYRKAWSPGQVLDYLREQSGKHFDPAVVDEFLQLLEEIKVGEREEE